MHLLWLTPQGGDKQIKQYVIILSDLIVVRMNNELIDWLVDWLSKLVTWTSEHTEYTYHEQHANTLP